MDAFERHPDDELSIQVTVLDRNEQRQSLGGVTDLRMTIYRQSNMIAVVEDDHDGCTIDEHSAETAGNVTYRREPDGILTRGRYLMKFKATIAGEPISFPERGYIPLVIA